MNATAGVTFLLGLFLGAIGAGLLLYWMLIRGTQSLIRRRVNLTRDLLKEVSRIASDLRRQSVGLGELHRSTVHCIAKSTLLLEDRLRGECTGEDQPDNNTKQLFSTLIEMSSQSSQLASNVILLSKQVKEVGKALLAVHHMVKMELSMAYETPLMLAREFAKALLTRLPQLLSLAPRR